jgi:hypothetical protein
MRSSATTIGADPSSSRSSRRVGGGRDPIAQLSALAVAFARGMVVQHERMEVDVEIEGAAEALNDHDGPPRYASRGLN